LARQVADDIAFPNGMAVTPDNSMLIVAESYSKRRAAFDIAADGSLSNRRVWAALEGGVPDGICSDDDNAVWYGDVPNKRCVRVREGGEVLETINLDRGCFACTLGGNNVVPDGDRVAWSSEDGGRGTNGPGTHRSRRLLDVPGGRKEEILTRLSKSPGLRASL
jgi:sugar lactone lactonase YvrE